MFSSLQILNAALQTNKLDIEPSLKQVFLLGFLEAKGRLPCPLAEFDAAVDTFLKTTRMLEGEWLQVLGGYVDMHWQSMPEGLTEITTYLRDQVIELAKQMKPAAADGEEPPVHIYFDIGEDLATVRQYLQEKEPLRGCNLGMTLLAWTQPIPGVDKEVITLEVVNAEGGPALVAYHRRGPRIVEAARPRYTVDVEPFEFKLNKHYLVHLRHGPSQS